MSKSLSHLFICDSFDTLNLNKDSSLVLMRSALRHQHKVYFCESHNLFLKEGYCFAQIQRVLLDTNQNLTLSNQNEINLNTLKCIWIRKDPPFDDRYLDLCWFLDFISDDVHIINKPNSLMQVNEKICTQHFQDLVPKSILATHPNYIKNIFKQKDPLILKPTDLFGGQDIFKTSLSDPKFKSIFKQLSKNFSKAIMIQAFVEAVKDGDKRILLWRGTPLGAILRKNSSGLSQNFMAGGQAFKCEINQRDLEIIKTIKPFITQFQLDFVGIDIIGTYLTEINVTSPTGLAEINAFETCFVEDPIFYELEKQLA